MLTEPDLNEIRAEILTALPDTLVRFTRALSDTEEGGREAIWTSAGETPCRVLPPAPRWARPDPHSDETPNAIRVVIPSDFEVTESDEAEISEVRYQLRSVPPERAWRLTRIITLGRKP